MTRHNVKWIVSLSNGETIYEGKGKYIEKEGDLSPWQRLLRHLFDAKAVITSLSLYTDDGQRWNLPSAGNNPKFRIYESAPKPIDFNMFRAIGADVGGKNLSEDEIKEMEKSGDHFTAAEAVFDGLRIQIWVNEKNPKVSWTLAVPE